MSTDKQDAARYRWLRDKSLMTLVEGPICILADKWGAPLHRTDGRHVIFTLDGAALDSAIDAQIELEPPK